MRLTILKLFEDAADIVANAESLRIDYNDHRSSYTTAEEEYGGSERYQHLEWVSDEAKKAAFEQECVWTVNDCASNRLIDLIPTPVSQAIQDHIKSICVGEFSSASIILNDYLAYDNFEEWVDNNPQIFWESEEDRLLAYATKRAWSVQIYKHTPVSFECGECHTLRSYFPENGELEAYLLKNPDVAYTVEADGEAKITDDDWRAHYILSTTGGRK